MGHETIGVKERQQRELGKNKRDRLNQGSLSRKPSTSDLRKQVAKIKPVTRHGGKRGR